MLARNFNIKNSTRQLPHGKRVGLCMLTLVYHHIAFIPKLWICFAKIGKWQIGVDLFFTGMGILYNENSQLNGSLCVDQCMDIQDRVCDAGVQVRYSHGSHPHCVIYIQLYCCCLVCLTHDFLVGFPSSLVTFPGHLKMHFGESIFCSLM